MIENRKNMGKIEIEENYLSFGTLTDNIFCWYLILMLLFWAFYWLLI